MKKKYNFLDGRKSSGVDRDFPKMGDICVNIFQIIIIDCWVQIHNNNIAVWSRETLNEQWQ